MIRLQLNSRTSRIDVYKSLPTIQVKNKYAISIEHLTIPATSSGLILNQPLFTVERRLRSGVVYENILLGLNANIVLPDCVSTFTPQNVKNSSDLLYQMNLFFRQLFLRLGVSGNFQNNLEHFDVTPTFLTNVGPQLHADWYQLGVQNIGGPIKTSIEAIFRCDGRIGFKFSENSHRLFVIKFTTEGKRIFGFNYDFVALNENKEFTNYIDPQPTFESFPTFQIQRSQSLLFVKMRYLHMVSTDMSLLLIPPSRFLNTSNATQLIRIIRNNLQVIDFPLSNCPRYRTSFFSIIEYVR